MNIAQAVFSDSVRVIDTHCHYNLEPIVDDWLRHWEKAQTSGVVASWIPGTTVESSQRAWEIAQQDPNLWAMVGVHPHEPGLETPEATILALRQLIEADRHLASPKILAVGEIGLDYFRIDPSDDAERERQRALCRAQLELAQEFGLMVSLHVRDKQLPSEPTTGNAYWDTLGLVKEANLDSSPILHCVSGPLPYVAAMLELGAYVSFAGNITYPSAEAIRQIWEAVSAERRLIETDAPYLAPQGWRGKECEPWMVTETAKWIESHIS